MNENVALSSAFRERILNQIGSEKIQMCIQCGTCSGICPFTPWMGLTLRQMVGALRDDTLDGTIAAELVWLCVSCCSCASVCPQEIPITGTLIAGTREELLLSGEFPAELQEALENTQRYGNVLGAPARKRADWARNVEPAVPLIASLNRPVDVLWFVGDYAAYHPRGQDGARAFARVLSALNVDYAILGREEVSDGDSQRLAGERGLFEMLAEKNGRAFSKYAFHEIITTDPHAYNAFKNEYPLLGIHYPVRHYTQFLAERLDDLQPMLTEEINALVTFHDPCYLGRANGIYEEPRSLLSAIPGVVLAEMPHQRANSLCCGGGGGGMWLDGYRWERTQNRLSEWRVREAMQARPAPPFHTTIGEKPKRKAYQKKTVLPATRILAVACPYEAPRFEDAVKTVPEASTLLIRDIAELLAAAIKVRK